MKSPLTQNNINDSSVVQLMKELQTLGSSLLQEIKYVREKIQVATFFVLICKVSSFFKWLDIQEKHNIAKIPGSTILFFIIFPFPILLCFAVSSNTLKGQQ